MATDFYGACTGSTGQRYDIFLRVTENYKNTENNTTNTTISLYLRRNDGYAQSAYNNYSNQNTVQINLGSQPIFSSNIVFDTRNGNTALLGTWTGDVPHNADGTFAAEVTASFSTSAGNLTGGSVTGYYTFVTIPRASAVSFSSQNVYFYESQIAYISSASSAFSHRLVLNLGSKTASFDAAAGATQINFTVPEDFACEMASTATAFLGAVLETFKDGTKVGQATAVLNLCAPYDQRFLPEFNVEITRIDGSVPQSLGEYVKGHSQVQVTVTDINTKLGAAMESVAVICGQQHIWGETAAFSLNQSGALGIYVALKDTRGFLTEWNSQIYVQDYEAPTVEINRLKRCDSQGNYQNDGTALFLDFTKHISSLNGKNSATVTARFKANQGQVWSGNAACNQSPAVLFDGEISQNSSYTLEITVTDMIESTTFQRQITSADIPFNIKKGGKGAAFGCFAEKDGELTVGWDMAIKGELKAESVYCESSQPEITSLVGTPWQGTGITVIPALKMCYLNFGANIAQNLEGGTWCVLGKINSPELLYGALGAFVGDSGTVSGTAGINDNGEIIFRPVTYIPAGTGIIISGFIKMKG